MPTASRVGAAKPPRRHAGPFAVALAALVGFAAGDAWKRPHQQLVTAGAVRAIDAYRATVSPFFARTGIVRCRFDPSCSSYAREAISRYGVPKGFFLAGGRILRCHPFAEGGVDPVP
jgi:putative membrane protein insertion efficiency factor